MAGINRRELVGSIAGLTTVVLAGCASSVDGAIPFTGPRFEAGAEREVTLEPEFFGENWEVYEDDEADAGAGVNGSNETNDSEESNESDESVTDELDFDLDDYPTSEMSYQQFEDEDSEWPSGIAFTYVAILDSGDRAKDVVTTYGDRVFVNADEPDVGDTAVRGEAEGVRVMLSHLGNALVMASAASINGFNTSPDNLTSLEACEELVARLDDL